jgi:hypothetical protein
MYDPVTVRAEALPGWGMRTGTHKQLHNIIIKRQQAQYHESGAACNRRQTKTFPNNCSNNILLVQAVSESAATPAKWRIV